MPEIECKIIKHKLIPAIDQYEVRFTGLKMNDVFFIKNSFSRSRPNGSPLEDVLTKAMKSKHICS